MYSLKTGEYFRANIWGMQLLRHAMDEAGVNLKMTRERGVGYDNDKKEFDHKDDVPLITCFCSNDGWEVKKDECVEIAEKLKDHPFNPNEEEQEGDVDFIKRFGEYCGKVADEGGFSVW